MPAPAVIPGPATPGPALYPQDAARISAALSGTKQGGPINSASSGRPITTWYVRAAGSNTNGGSSSSLTPDRTGTDGNIAGLSTIFTSASAAFTQADVGKGIYISSTPPTYAKIMSVTNGTTVILSNPAGSTGVAFTWAIGGAWATPAPLLDANVLSSTQAVGVQGGDTVAIGAGVYRKTYAGTTNQFASFASAGAVIVNQFGYLGEVKIIGDVDGRYTGDAGEVQLTGYTTNDKTVPAASVLLALSTTPAMRYLTFQYLTFVGGSASPKILNSGDASNIAFRDCTFIGLTGTNSSMLGLTPTAFNNHNILFERCKFSGLGAITASLPSNNQNDYDYGLTFRNCFMHFQGIAVDPAGSGALAFKGGGISIINCTIIAGTTAVRTTGTVFSTNYPIRIENCIIFGGLNASVTGHIVENNNIIIATTPRTNIGIGSKSISNDSYASLLYVGQATQYGAREHPYWMPTKSSPFSKFTMSPNMPVDDISGQPRLSTEIGSVGAFEPNNSFVKETTTVQAGSNAISITGEGIQDFDLPVDAGAITISVYCRYDSNYSGPLPRLMILANGEMLIGQTEVPFSTASLNSFQQASITVYPTASGILTVRVISGDVSGVGKTIFDSFAVA